MKGVACQEASEAGISPGAIDVRVLGEGTKGRQTTIGADILKKAAAYAKESLPGTRRCSCGSSILCVGGPAAVQAGTGGSAAGAGDNGGPPAELWPGEARSGGAWRSGGCLPDQADPAKARYAVNRRGDSRLPNSAHRLPVADNLLGQRKVSCG